MTTNELLNHLYFKLKEIPRNEADRTKKAFPNNVHQVQTFDSRRELQDSLPLCHPNDDYLKDFKPLRERCVWQEKKTKIVSIK